jgi:hypothetical protein
MRIVALFLVFCGLSIQAQQTTTTDTSCSTSGSTTNCTSTTYRPSSAPSPIQRQNYQTGQQIGQTLGTGIAGMVQRHKINSFCRKYPGATWHYTQNGQVMATGTCPAE